MSRNYYEKDGIEFIRVSAVIGQLDKSDALVPWAVGETIKYLQENPNDYDRAKYSWKNVRDDAANIGTITHGIIKQYIKAKINNIDFDPTSIEKFDDKVETAFLAFLEWEKKNDVKWIASEVTYYDDREYFAGTIDAIAIVNSQNTIIDFKTGSGIYDSHILQITAYSCLTYIDDAIILRIDKVTGEFETKEFKVTDKNVNAFYNLLDFYYNYKNRRIKNPRGAKK